jgi:cobalt-zinc-cadmium efflux system membrane fusion protein
MKALHILTALGVSLLASAAGYRLMNNNNTPESATENVVQKPSAEPGVLRFPTASPQLARIKVEGVENSPVPMDEPLAARVSYDENRTSRIFSPIAGRVTEIRAQLGETVKAGAPLAVLDAPDLGSARADLAKAQADADQKHAAFQRARSLLEAEVIPRRDLEAAQADWQQAHAEVERARLRISNLTQGGQVEGERFVLRAPLSGVVASRKINPAMEVRPDADEPLFVVSDLGKLSVLVDVPERNLAGIRVGKSAQIEVPAYPNRSFQGKVVQVDPTLDPQTRRVQARIAVDNAEGLLKPEMYAKVAIQADGQEALPRLPIGALLVEGVKNFVFVEREAGVFEKRELSLAVQTRSYAYASSGIKSGERVVSVGALLLNAELTSSSR